MILNTFEAAEALLVKRSSNYSDRPFPTMSGKLMRREKSIFMMYVFFTPDEFVLHFSRSNTDRLRKYRKLLHQSFNSSVTHRYWPVHEHISLVMIGRILSSPELLFRHLRR